MNSRHSMSRRVIHSREGQAHEQVLIRNLLREANLIRIYSVFNRDSCDAPLHRSMPLSAFLPPNTRYLASGQLEKSQCS